MSFSIRYKIIQYIMYIQCTEHNHLHELEIQLNNNHINTYIQCNDY